MLLIDPASGQIADANPAATRFYGYGRDALQAMTIQQINTLSPEQVAAERALAEREGRNYFIFRHRLASGEVRTVEVYSHPFAFDGHRLLLSVIHDITPGRNLEQGMWHYQQRLEELVAQRTAALEARSHWLLAALLLVTAITAALIFNMLRRKRAEMARKLVEGELRLQQRRLQSILDGTHVGTWEWNVQTGETTFNERWAEIVGYRLEELQPVSIETWMKFTHPDDLKNSGDLLEKHFAGQMPFYECEVRMRHKDGHWVWVLDRGRVATWTEDGKPLLMSGTHQDISARKRSEDDLISAKLAAEAANIAKSRFLATMSHEIRTPMNGILGMAQLLLGASMSEAERRDCTRTILNSGRTLLTLLNDILDLSKIEAGKLSLEMSVVDPRQILNETQALFFDNARAKGLRIDSAWSGPACARYRSDPHRLRQMLSNLVNNAIKFTPQGEIRLLATELVDTGPSPLLEFSVTDTGIGIDPGRQDLLFKPFSQVDSSTSRQFGGSGLGLSIVRSLARSMGGDAGVVSESGQGSRFWFRIRAEHVAESEERRHLERGRGTQASEDIRPQLKGRVLIVEDTPTNQQVLNALLPKIGVQPVLAENGQEAVASVIERGERFDAILMDLDMPIMDGLKATERIRAWETLDGRPATPIIAITANAFAEDRARCLRVGMDDFLAKPVLIEDLLHVLGRWLPDDPSRFAAEREAAPEPSRTLDVPRFRELANALLPMLAQNRYDALERFAELETLAVGSPQAASLRPIRQLLYDLHFDKAQAALSAVLDGVAQQETRS